MTDDGSPSPDESSTERFDLNDRLAAGQTKFGRYTLEAIAGKGGMGVVWRARDLKLERTVALKFMRSEVAADSEAVRDLKRETKRCLDLTHPNIVRVYDFVEAGSDAAIAMEFVDGESLARRKVAAPGGCLSVTELAPLVAQLCAALDYAHAKARIVHRDLKPANLLITREGDLKVSDFGIARSLAATGSRLTSTVVMRGTSGTLSYMSPQQLIGNPPTESDDIYALGVTLYELLTGKPPFFTGDVTHQILNLPPIGLTARRAELGTVGAPTPRNWEETILACLAKKPMDRPQSAGEVAELLGLATKSTKTLSQVGGAAETVVPLNAPRKSVEGASLRYMAGPPRQTGRKSPLYITLALVALGGVFAVYFWPKFTGDSDQEGAAPSHSTVSVSPSSSPIENPVTPTLDREFIVTVDPADAEARLSLGPISELVTQRGRAVVKDLPDGEHELKMQAAGYQPFTMRVTVKNGHGSVEAKLVPVLGSLEITARPGTIVTTTDARGRATRIGTVPDGGVLTEDKLLTIGTYTLRLEHPDLTPVEQTGVELVIGRTIKISPAQTPLPGELRVLSVPTGAEVRVNGIVAGATPATIKGQPSEKLMRIEVLARGYRRTEQSVTLKPKEVRTLDVGTLTAEAGGVSFRFANADFRSEQAKILIDGKAGDVKPSIVAGPLQFDDLKAGTHTVAITHPDYAPWSTTVTVLDQKTTPVEVNLTPKPGRLSLRVSGPIEFTLLANGQPVGLPLAGAPFELPAGRPLDLRVQAKGYKDANRTLTLAANGAEIWEAVLEKLSKPETSQPHENTPGMSFGQKPQPGQAWTIADLALVMQPIAPGTFLMGNSNSDKREPIVSVTLTQHYWLGRTEVTQAQWTEVMGSYRSGFKGGNLPIENVSWEDAMEFCRKLTERERVAGRLSEDYIYTLPTEAQWEYACRAGTTGEYAGNLDSMGWYGKNSSSTIHPVGQKQANTWGLYDMHGNVWEWCADWSGYYAGGSVTDPTGPPSGSFRVYRGGSWNGAAAYCTSSFRYAVAPVFRGNVLGFRLALVPTTNRSLTNALTKEPMGQMQNAAAPETALRGEVPQTGQAWTIPGLALVMQPIAPGTFTMGDDDHGTQRVTLTQPYWLGKTEITQAQWTALMKSNRSGFKGGDLPVEKVSWEDAMEFCRKLTDRERAAGRLLEGHTYTLPTEAQWEYACRAGSTGDYAGDLDAMAWYGQNSDFTTHPVGQKQANTWGLVDMHGNVAEWCADWYGNYPGGSVTDPTGAALGTDRVHRGGGLNDETAICRSAFRYGDGPDLRSFSHGFRLALTSVTNPLPTNTQTTRQTGQKQSTTADATKEQRLTFPQVGRPYENSLGQKFVPVPGTDVLFCIWETREQDYSAFVKATGRAWASANAGATYPAVKVSWDAAKAFCSWLTEKERREGKLGPRQKYRLPTDVEWSVAVGLPQESGSTPQEKDAKIRDIYPWGNQWPPPQGAGKYGSSLQLDSFAFAGPAPVGSFSANHYGIYDLGGNVWEWCEEFYNGSSGVHVLRGASCFNSSPDYLLSARRSDYTFGSRDDDIGFRVACVVGSAGDSLSAQ